MTRTEYFEQLEQALSQLHPTAKQEALDYFNEFFDEKADEQVAIQELGSPEEVAKEIIANLPEDALQDPHNQSTSDSANPFNFDFDFDFDFQFDWDEFFKNFRFSSNQTSKQNSLKTKVEELPNCKEIHIYLEDNSLTVQAWDDEVVLFSYPTSLVDNYQSFEYQLVDDHLYISSKPIPGNLNFSNNQISSAILKIPKSLFPLSTVNLKLIDSSLTIVDMQVEKLLEINSEDSNLTLIKVQSSATSVQLEDTSLTLTDSQFDEFTCRANDSVVYLTSVNMSTARAELEDCVWNHKEFILTNTFSCHAQDSVLSFGPIEDINLDITEEDSSLKLPKDKTFTMIKDDDTSHLSYKQATSPAQLIIQCEDCQVSIG
ncbi:DUF1700 domain-containing protein [Streptococcus parasuis]|uniref:DUF1700 domain-containing protein n=1 Tax=Streptococcus parasuis TaxID=1501662 RepID=UPI0040645312